MSQPPLSRAIQRLERRLGVQLLRRSHRSISLTPAGEVLLSEARIALDAIAGAQRRTQRAASEQPGVVVLATKAGVSSDLLSSLLEAYAAEPGAAKVDVVLCGPGEQVRLLSDGRADVALLQRPYDSTTGFDVEELHTEPQVLVLPTNHPLANRPCLSTAEIESLVDLPMPRWPRPDGTCDDGPGPQVRDQTQLLQLIALGRACAFVPESVRASLGNDHAAVPVPEAPPVSTVIAWASHSRSRAVADLVRTATCLAGPTRGNELIEAGYHRPRPDLSRHESSLQGPLRGEHDD